MKSDAAEANTLFFRAPPELIERLDRFVAASRIPELTRARALRMLLADALKREERKS
jgi:hypothetical protein